MQKYGRLTVVDDTKYYFNDSHFHVKCRCDCGNITYVRPRYLITGRTQSCGCYKRDLNAKHYTIHGLYDDRLYNIWSNMIDRCENPRCKAYKHYGARGISVCDEWHKPICFYKWAYASGYSALLTIDRIDVNGDYCPNNCRWVSYKIQARNKRNNVHVQFQGVDWVLADLTDKYNVDYSRVYKRIFHLGWDITDAIMKDVRPRSCPEHDAMIYEEYTRGQTAGQLASKYKVSNKQIYHAVQRHRSRNRLE